MNRRIVRLAPLTMVALIVIACGQASEDPLPPTPPPSNVDPGGGDPQTTPIPSPPPTTDGGDANAADVVTTPSATDGIRNGKETDIDCGGPDPIPRCAADKTCVSADDCLAKACTAGKCTVIAPSCTGASGTLSCGLAGDENCCTSLPVPGGSYKRYNDVNYPATVSAFTLDKFEITVGRIRAFFNAKGGNPSGNPPLAGAGAHPKIPNSGWRASFNVRLPGSWAEINERLGAAGCTAGGDNSDGGAATWTPTPGPYESLPITCLDWYTFFAFCAWDGGRIPTDAEWGFAAGGGDEQRQFAWTQPGSTLYDKLMWGVHDDIVAASLWDEVNAVYKFSVGTPFRTTDPVTGKVNDGPAHIAVPGKKTGRGKWGHADLTGNVLEYLLDIGPIPQGTCTDCAFVNWPDPPQDQAGFYPVDWWVGVNTNFVDGTRYLRGGSWDPTHPPFVWHAYNYKIASTYYAAGARCAR